jgi:hypothetical protein
VKNHDLNAALSIAWGRRDRQCSHGDKEQHDWPHGHAGDRLTPPALSKTRAMRLTLFLADREGVSAPLARG